jgi:hypothetical protein
MDTNFTKRQREKERERERERTHSPAIDSCVLLVVARDKSGADYITVH